METLDRGQWEALCDGCGKCCLHKLEDDDTGVYYETNVACTLLDLATARCKDYRKRRKVVPDCVRLTSDLAHTLGWLPASCAYRLRAEGLPLPDWHYLISGDRDAVHRAGASVIGRAISEDVAGPLEQHIIWPYGDSGSPRAVRTAMLDWLRADPRAEPTVELTDRLLPIAIRRRANARRMTLRLAPDGSEARVSIPPHARSAEAIAFVRSRADWLEAQLGALPVRLTPGPGAVLPFRGEALTIDHAPGAPRRPTVAGGAIRCGGPVGTLTARLGRWLEGEARRLLAEDLSHYCARAGVTPPALALSRAQRRWGSCAQGGDGRAGTIRINWRLVMAPDFVRRSVVAHEVAHLLHFDHSPRFHAALAALYEGDIAAANRWLKRHGRSLYAPFG